MANSFQMAVRAGIMIVTMVAIPLLAIFGKQLPELIEGIYRGNVKTDEWQTRPATPVAAPVSNASVNQLAGQQQRADLTPAPAFQPSAGSLNPALGTAPKIEPPPLAPSAFQAAQPLPINPTNTATILHAATTWASVAAKHAPRPTRQPRGVESPRAFGRFEQRGVSTGSTTAA